MGTNIITNAKFAWLKESSSGTSAYYGIEGLTNQVSGITFSFTDGAQLHTTNVLTSIKEKAIQAATDTSTAVDRQAIRKEIEQLIDQIDEDALVITNGGQCYPVFVNTAIALQQGTNNNVLSWESFDIKTGEKVIFDNNNYLDIVDAHVGIKPGSINGIAKNSQTAPTIDENTINIYGYGSIVDSTDGIAKNSQTAPTIHGIVYVADNSAISSLSGDFIGNYADGNGGAIYYVNSGVIIDDKIQPEQAIAWFGVAQNYSSKVSSAFFNLVALENSSDFVL